MKRRSILLAGLGALGLARLAWYTPAAAKERMRGRLVVIGGAEDREGDKIILRRFVELAAGEDPRIAVITAASAFPDFAWRRYERALTDIGVRRLDHVALDADEDANDPMRAAALGEAGGVLITGGNQRRLLDLIGGTAVHEAIRQAYREGGACIGGTSAGAAAMSRHMLVGRGMSPGMGLIEDAIIDQHFTQRGRLARLVEAVGANPRLIGIGVDENTAFILGQERGFEVLGAGDVTIVDARRLPGPLIDADAAQLLERPEMRVHRLPAGTRYRPDGDSLAGRGRVSGLLTLPEGQESLPALQDLLPVLLRL